MLMLRLAVVALGIVTGAGPVVAALAPGDYVRTLDTGGHTRTYRIHVPPGYTGASAVPLVLDFHGLGSNSAQQSGLSGMIGVSNQQGFLVAHPDGFRNAWNAGICCRNDDIDDVAFVRALVAAIATEANVDARRVYATGLSNGGAMSQFLACEAADLFAAAAPMAFPLPYWILSECRPVRAIPVLAVMGLTDVLVTYDRGPFPTAPATFAYWRDVNGCTGTAPDRTVTSGQSRCETYTRCANGTQAGLCSVVALAIPGSAASGHILYLNDDFVLATVAWDFLSQFTLPETTAPTTIALRGTGNLRVGKTQARAPLAWTITLGAGTWTATDAAGKVYTGSAQRRGRGRRTLALTLTTDSRATLSEELVVQLAAATNTTGLLVGVEPADRLQLRLDRAGRPLRLTGRLRLLRGSVAGATIGRFTVKARR